MRTPHHNIPLIIIDNHERMPQRLERSIQESFPNYELSSRVYQDIWSAMESEHFSPAFAFIRQELEDYEGMQAIPLIKERYPGAFIILSTQDHDLDLFARAYARGAGKVLLRDQWLFRKVARIIHERLESLIYRPGAFERFLRYQRGNSVGIIEPNPDTLFRLHFRVTHRCKGRVEGYRSLEDFYERVESFPEVLLINHMSLGESNSFGLERLKCIKPDMRIILTYQGRTDLKDFDRRNESKAHAIADISNTRLNDLDRLVSTHP